MKISAFQKLVDHLPDAVFLVRLPRREIVYANHAAYEMFGAAPDSLLGLLTEMLHVDAQHSRDFNDASSAALEAHPLYRDEYRMRRRSGEVFPSWHTVSTLEDDEGQQFAVSVIRDISERRRREAEHLQASKLEALGRLTGGVAHDFNNLLTVILGNAELLVEESGGQGRTATLARGVVHASQRASALTNRLLSFARQRAISREAIDVNQAVLETVELLRRTLGSTVTLRTETAEAPWLASADHTQLCSCLINLAVNARDAMPDGGTLRISTANLTLTDPPQGPDAPTPGEWVAISVEDDGTGIEPALLERVFEPFFTTKPDGEGTGLGLSMVASFARDCGGYVTLRSTTGKGTRVQVLLPRHAEGPTQDADAPTPGAVAAPVTVLLVEDDGMVRTLVRTQLESIGHEVEAVASADEALARLHERNDIGLLVSDVLLGSGASGPQLAVQARRLHPSLALLFISGHAPEREFDRAGLPKDTPLLRKPFRRHELAAAVRRAVHG